MKKSIYWGGLAIVLIGIISFGLYSRFYNKDLDNIEIIDNNSEYDASKEIKLALKNYNKDKKAEVISSFETKDNYIALSFEGISDSEITKEVIGLLNKYNVKSTFFVSGVEAAEDTDLIKLISKNGHSIGSIGLSGKKHMDKLSKDELITDFTKANKVIDTITGEETSLLKCSSTEYTDNLLASAYASGNEYLVDSKNYLSYQSFKNYEEAKGYVKSLKKGEIISIKLEGVLDESEYTKKEENPAIDKEAGIEKKEEETKEYASILEVVEWLCKSVNEEGKNTIVLDKYNILEKSNGIGTSNNFPGINSGNSSSNPPLDNSSDNEVDTSNIDFNKLVDSNNGVLADSISRFYTTQEAVTYTFRGISDNNVLGIALFALDVSNAKATFFVTKKEMLEYPDRIERILSKGHEIGNGGVTANSDILDKTPAEVSKEIYEVDKMLKDRGIYTNAYMSGFGYSNDSIREAVSSVTSIEGLEKYELITYTKAPIVSKYKGKDSSYIINDYLNTNTYMSLSKGEIVYFRLDSGLVDDRTIYDLITKIDFDYVKYGNIKKYNSSTGEYDLMKKPLDYSVVTVSNIQSNYEKESNYGRYNLISNPKYLNTRSYEESMKIMPSNYIGNKDVQLTDFTNEEASKLDKSGTIDTNGENVIFFSFDDWGGDVVINDLLEVFDRHNVKANFFVIAQYIDENSGIANANPNLLRTIALKGHDIGSHNYNHEILVDDKDVLLKSLPKSYYALSRVIGDLDSLKSYFRPPTLYVKKEGLSAVYESGFDYSISGNISLHDYEATSAGEIINDFRSQLQEGKGNIIVMHMNNQAYYTADAIDIFLTNNEKGLYGKKYKIAKFSDYLK